MKPNLRPMPPVETPAPSQIQYRPETDGAFQISPSTGVLAPYKNEEFRLSFHPNEVTRGLDRIKKKPQRKKCILCQHTFILTFLS